MSWRFRIKSIVGSDNVGFRKLEKRGLTAKFGDNRMFYALRRRAGSDRQTLVEFARKADMETAGASGEHVFSIVLADAARDWVRRGNEHETGLFVDEGQLRYARTQAG
jgi:hypothetical protein